MKIFQVYYKHEQLDSLDPSFTPYDNISNPRPELREWHAMEKIYEWNQQLNLDYWGVVSWRFHEKTGIKGSEFVDFIEANPGHELYFINPAIINEAVFANSWEQGDIHHPNISDIANAFLSKVGYEDVDVKYIVLDRTRTMYSNYFVGSRKFWDRYIEFVRKIFVFAEQDAEFKHQVFAPGLSNYARDSSLPNFIFLLERLISTFIELEDVDAIGYTPNTPHPKYEPYIRTVTALSDLKVLINRHDSAELYHIWDHFRRDFLEKNAKALSLE
jgi:hypothetical protein